MTPPYSAPLKDVSDTNKSLTQCLQADQADQAKDSMKEATLSPTIITAKVFQPIHSSEIYHVFPISNRF